MTAITSRTYLVALVAADGDEFYRMLDGVVVDDAKLFNATLQEWEHFYNFERPHGALGGQTPYERLRQKTTTPV